MMLLIRHTKLLLLLLSVAFMMQYCSEPHIDMPDYTPKIAVDAYIEVGRPPVMYLTYSSPFISNYDSMDFVDMVKFNVSAYVITEEDDTIGFTRRTNTSEFPPFKYTMAMSDLIGEAGKTYKLLIRKSGVEDITASTSIPIEPPQIIGIAFERLGLLDTLGRYNLLLRNDDKSLFHFIQNKKQGEVSFYPTRFPARSNRLIDEDILSYYLTYGGKSNVWLTQEEKDSLGESEKNHLENMSYHIDDTITFKVSSLDAQSYDVLSSVFLDTEFPDNPFKPISQLPISNVSNGIGRWTGMNSVTKTVGGRP